MQRELMECARWTLKAAQWSLGESDDIALRFAAYYIQQYVVPTLKCCLKELGLSYTDTHRIRELFPRLPQGQTLVSHQWLEWISCNLSTLNDWERNTRYTEGYHVERELVSEMLCEATAFYDSVMAALYVADDATEERMKEQREAYSASAVLRLNLNTKK